MNNSSTVHANVQVGLTTKDILTTAEQNELAAKKLSFQVMTNGEVFWFTDNAVMFQEYLGHLGFKRISTACPTFLPARRTFSSKMITTAEKYISVYRVRERQITSAQELLDYLDSKPSA